MFSISHIEDKLVALYQGKIVFEITKETSLEDIMKHIQLTNRLGFRDGSSVS